MDITAATIPFPESVLFLQWGNRKRNSCARATTNKRNISISHRCNNTRNTNFVLHSPSPSSPFDDIAIKPSKLRSRPRMKSSSSSPSPENENHSHYTTRRASLGVADCNNYNTTSINKKKIIYNNSASASASAAVEGVNRSSGRVWPKLYLGLSNKEKEEDFMAMKGCKPPHRPKKRPKAIQRSVLMVCPGGWLADMCQERYQVREKKSSKKRPQGLKAMGSLAPTLNHEYEKVIDPRLCSLFHMIRSWSLWLVFFFGVPVGC